MINLMHGDCLEKMKDIESGSIDMILTDPPYGTTACKWDSIIPLEPMWEQLKRITKPSGAIVMTASQPFTTTLISSNIEMFKYCWVWQKNKASNHINAPFQPLKTHEDIVVFSKKASTHSKSGVMSYYPQGIIYVNKVQNRKGKKSETYNTCPNKRTVQKKSNYPKTLINFSGATKPIHPTQKPVELMEYLIKTYTNENETVLDFTMGSGSTGVACKNLNRKFIGIELDENYFNIAKKRIKMCGE